MKAHSIETLINALKALTNAHVTYHYESVEAERIHREAIKEAQSAVEAAEDIANIGREMYFNQRRKIYYAHSLHLYNSLQEQRDIVTLQELGFEVFNPNQPEIQRAVEEARKINPDLYMGIVFNPILDSCDCIAFRSHIDMKIPAGVAHEVKYMMNQGKPVLELPMYTKARELDVEETRYYLKMLANR